MPAWKPELFQKEAVLEYYNTFGDGSFRVYAGAKPEDKWCRFEYLEEDKIQGTVLLTEALDGITANPLNTNVYCLELIKKINPRGRKKVVDSTCITFQLNGNTPGYQPGMGSFYPIQQPSINSALEKRFERIEAILLAEDEEEEETKPAVQTGSRLENAIAGIIEEPEKLNKLAMNLTGIFKAITGKGELPAVPKAEPTAAEKQLQESIERLKAADPDLSHDLGLLATVAEKDPEQFKMLLTVLRTNIK